MRIFSTLTALIAIATFVVAAPHSGVRDVMDDITAAGQVIATLREHTNHISDPGFNMLTLMNDNKAITTVLDRIATDAMAVRTFDEGDATEIIARTRRLANQIEDVTAMLISKKDAIPLSLHGAVAQGLQAIKSHAKGAGDALVNDCPADKKAEAMRVYSEIGDALNRASRAFSS